MSWGHRNAPQNPRTSMSPTLKSVLITGCSAGGIGAAIAAHLAKEGHHIFVTARNTSKIPKHLSTLSNVTLLPLDVSSAESVDAAARAVAESGRGLDVLVNNAGAGYVMPILDIDIDEAKRLYDTNVWGVVRTVQAFASLLIKSRGRIVNLSSIGGALNMPWIAAYGSSKAALTQISETLRLELSPFGITVVNVMGGVMVTNFDANVPEFRLREDSRYAPIQNIMSGWASGKSKPKGCSADEFAKEVSPDIVGRVARGGLTWRGTNATTVRLLTMLAPAFVTVSASESSGIFELLRKESN